MGLSIRRPGHALSRELNVQAPKVLTGRQLDTTACPCGSLLLHPPLGSEPTVNEM